MVEMRTRLAKVGGRSPGYLRFPRIEETNAGAVQVRFDAGGPGAVAMAVAVNGGRRVV